MKSALFILITLGCGVPADGGIREAPVKLTALVLEQPDGGGVDAGVEEELDVGDAGVWDAGAAPVRVADMNLRLPPHRSSRYVARCRREARREGVVVEALENKPEARARARALARSGVLDPVLIFSRMAYGEAGSPQPGRNDQEYFAMLAVMDSLRGGMSRVEMFVNSAPRRVFPHPGHVRNAWIAELQLDGRRPPSWPRPQGRRFHSYPTWRSYGCPRWLATVDAVRRLLRVHPDRVGAGSCEEVPDHWGGAMDQHRADRGGWRMIRCGHTLNRYFVVPERAARRGLPAQNQVLEGATGRGDASDELRAGHVQRPPEGVQRGGVPDLGSVVLDLRVRGDGQRQADGSS